MGAWGQSSLPHSKGKGANKKSECTEPKPNNGDCHWGKKNRGMGHQKKKNGGVWTTGTADIPSLRETRGQMKIARKNQD